MIMYDEIPVLVTNYFPGKKIVKVIGTVMGITVRSRGLGGNIAASLRSLAGGEIKEYVKLLSDARNVAIQRLKQAAKEAGANAIISMRFDSSELGNYMTEIVAYGTAVVVEDLQKTPSEVTLT